MRDRAAQYSDWEQHAIRCGACGFHFPIRRLVSELPDPIPCPRCKKSGTSPFAPVMVTVTEDNLEIEGLAPRAVPWGDFAAQDSRGLLEEEHEETVVSSGKIELAAAEQFPETTMSVIAPEVTAAQAEQMGALDPAPSPSFRAPPVPPMFGGEPAEQQGKGNRRSRRDG